MSEQTESAPNEREAQAGKPEPLAPESGQAALSQEVVKELISESLKPLIGEVKALKGDKDRGVQRALNEVERISELVSNGQSFDAARSQVEKEKSDQELLDKIASLESEIAIFKGQGQNDQIAETLREAGIDPASEEAKRLAMEHKDATSLKAALFSRLLKERKPASEGVITQGNTPQKRSTDMEKLHAEYVKEMKSHVGKSDVAGLQARTKRKFRREGLNV